MRQHMIITRQQKTLRLTRIARSAGLFLLVLLVSCGRPDGQQANPTQPAATEIGVAPATLEPTAVPAAPEPATPASAPTSAPSEPAAPSSEPTSSPSEPTVANPPATFAAVLPGISSPGETTSVTPTSTVNAPLVVTPMVTRTIPIVIGDQTLTAEIASTGEERQRGLMERQSMDQNAGMLFVFSSDQPVSFWMRNTALPLSIAFIDSSGIIQGLADMQPFDDQTFHISPVPVRYALEVNQGWFAEHNIKVGDRAEFSLPDGIEIN